MRSNGISSLLCLSIVISAIVSLPGNVSSAASYNHTHQLLYNRNLQHKRHDDFIIPESHESRNLRKSKLFPLFTIIRFTNEICRTTSEETGICYTRNQCTSLGGLAQGNCASGLGVCCRFIATCGAIVYQNGTSFQNPNYPSKYVPMGGSDVCQIRIRKQQNVCQLRLNFIAFDIEGPAATPTAAQGAANAMNDAGVCKIDSLALTSSGATVPSLCGSMNGQHLYVDFGSSDTITLNLLLGGASQKERTWNIEILTIPCNSIARAPTGCLQYFTGVSGVVESFNFQGGMHLANLDYSACVRMEDGMRFIDWSPCSPNSVRFGGGAAMIPTTPAANAACPNTLTDYLIIMQGVSFPLLAAQTNPTTSTTDRYCDLSFQQTNSYVRTSARPFLIHFRTDSAEGGTADVTSVGYCLRWQQNPQ
ncbi:Tolloid-like protein 1 [Orchesella cincta]|uniref:Tolloid-like protein 1 n=1 Tax=Orchesella cincta TaxID=48709 RepID=A0A1D2NGJ9_ORCCI|nr:Tolloid-like protein 1 [Orchesella cincta]